jgi:hypothetical protein
MHGEKRKPEATALMLVRLLQLCPVCKSPLTEHRYASFATAVIGEGQTPSLIGFFKTILEHRWADLKQFQKWESESDDLEAYAVHCTTGKISLATVRSPEEFWHSDQLIHLEVLELEDSRQLEAFIQQDKWLPLASRIAESRA